MTGMECLKQEMLKRGCTKSQVESKIVPIVVDILAQTGTHYLQHWEDEQDLSRLRKEARITLFSAEVNLNQAEARIQQSQESMKLAEDRYEEIMKSLEDYVASFEESLRNCETAEGRDRLRAAQTYIQSISVKTAFDNTAYIVSLGAITSGGQIAPIEEYKKLNPKLGAVKVSDEYLNKHNQIRSSNRL